MMKSYFSCRFLLIDVENKHNIKNDVEKKKKKVKIAFGVFDKTMKVILQKKKRKKKKKRKRGEEKAADEDSSKNN